MSCCMPDADKCTCYEGKTLRERTEIAGHNRYHEIYNEFGTGMDYDDGFQYGALHGPPIEFAIEALVRIGAISDDQFAVGVANWALKELKEARR